MGCVSVSITGNTVKLQERMHISPRIENALDSDSLSHACWLSTLDLARGYWPVEVHPKITAFINLIV